MAVSTGRENKIAAKHTVSGKILCLLLPQDYVGTGDEDIISEALIYMKLASRFSSYHVQPATKNQYSVYCLEIHAYLRLLIIIKNKFSGFVPLAAASSESAYFRQNFSKNGHMHENAVLQCPLCLVHCRTKLAAWPPGSADTVCPRPPLTLTFNRLTLKLVRESHRTFLPNLGTLGLCVLELFAMY